MAFCNYKARNLDGSEQVGSCWCTCKEDLARSFRDKGYYLIQYNEVRINRLKFFNQKVSSKELYIFCSQLFSLLSAGINVSEAIGIIKQETSDKVLQKCLEDIEKMLQQGIKLSDSMKSYNNVFPEFLVNMIGVGEESGNLDKVFYNLSKYYSDENAIKNKIIKAMIYPCTVFILSILIMELMIINIVPIFATTLTELGAPIPSTTRMAMALSSLLRNNLFSIILILILAGFIIAYSIKRDRSKFFIHKFFISNLLTQNLVKKSTAIKFARTLGILLGSGTQIIKALDVTKSVIGNRYVKYQLELYIDKINMGYSISKSMDNTNIFPATLCSMLRVGEETGYLDEMLLKASDVMEEELKNLIDKATTLIQPTMILILSIFISYMLISLMLPMLNIMDTI